MCQSNINFDNIKYNLKGDSFYFEVLGVIDFYATRLSKGCNPLRQYKSLVSDLKSLGVALSDSSDVNIIINSYLTTDDSYLVIMDFIFKLLPGSLSINLKSLLV